MLVPVIMKIAVLGENTDNLVTISKYANAQGYEIVFSGFVGSYLTMKDFVFENKDSDVILLDITKLLCVSDDELSVLLKYVRNEYKGKFVCYNYQGQNKRLSEICAKAGVKYFIDAIMAVDVKKQFVEIIESEDKFGNIGAEGEKTKKLKAEEKAENCREKPDVDTGMVKTICVIGVLPRIGTTTQAISIAKFLNENGIKACYVQGNNSIFVKSLQDNYEGIKYDDYSDLMTYENVDIFSSDDKTYRQKYTYKVIDFGVLGEEVPSEFLYGDISIVVAGVSPEELSVFNGKVEMLYNADNVKYVFSYISDKDKKETLEMMGTAKNRVYFAPYRPSAFESVDEESSMLYQSLLGIKIDTQGKKRGKRKKRFGKQR